MLMADDRSNLWSSEDYSLEADDLRDDLTIDIGTILDILNENPDSSEGKLEDLSFNDASEGLPNNEGALLPRDHLSGPTSFSPSSDIRNGISDASSDYTEKSGVSDGSKRDSRLQLGSPVHSSSGSLTDWIPFQGHGHGNFCLDKDIVSRNASSNSLQDCRETHQELRNCSETFSFPAGYFSNHVADNREVSNVDQRNHELELQLACSEGVDCDDDSYETPSNKKNMLEVSVASSMDEFSGSSMYNGRLAGYGDQYSNAPVFVNLVDPSFSAFSNEFSPCDFGFNLLPNNDNKMIGMMKEKVEHLTQDTSSNCVMSNQVQKLDDADWEVLAPGDLAGKGLSAASVGVNYASLGDGGSFSRLSNEFFMKQENDAKLNRLIASEVIAFQHGIDITSMKSSADTFGVSFGQGRKPSESGYWMSNSSENHEFSIEDERNLIPESKRPRLGLDEYDGTASGNPSSVFHDRYLDLLNSEPSGVPVSSTIKHQFLHANVTKESWPSLSGQEVRSDSSVQTCSTDDDEDVCILEDISGPARPYFSAFNGKSFFVPKSTVICNSFNSVGLGHKKANGERFVFRAALEDLCQPKSEDAPPEGLLAVPLLKHQRIALSWMVKKENDAVRCSGGFLADDQGLGKTVSTIALILKERSPSSTKSNGKESEAETLNLDDDDDDDDDDPGSDGGKPNEGVESCQVSGSFCGQKMAAVHAKRRPAAGTLIVCPTSVLRQWSEELQNKVSSKANVSVLVYHGSNRTRDPYELANYDVVLTTYSIVSMEVPKQPLVDEEEDETKSLTELSSSKKRKYPPSASKKSSKSKDNLNGESLCNRPLAAVGWFRVVLDEAQCIKNHRTQVARACWGLRAKRRWCLSGTPMQNAIDDLYSYFRFLKYDPYWIYKEFCTGIKAPINDNPSNGYKKLQAVLRTIMLRRTKGTILDGEPIINLPPKTIKLCKVDFTQQERDFYCRLEADSRAQFAEYAAAGTVKQNYVNILLMLLRLRQACDHPLLVKGFASGSNSISSLDMAKKLPHEKQIHLLNCFETSLAICGLCSDPPEDAVITSCGHVFCNQCICEHLSGDDTLCPTAKCKAHLNRSSVFSVATLRCSLSDRTTLESNSNCSFDCAYDSSKIKAAIEVLQSVTKRQNFSQVSSSSSVEEGISSVENTSSVHSGGLHGKTCSKEEIKGMAESSCGSVTVVGEKAIVFSQWTRMLDLLEGCLKDCSIQYRRLDGTMSVVARDKAVKDFNTLPEVSVMIMSLKAASLGLNMVAACHVLLLDLWWNPTTEDQAIDRAHRIGQTRPVTVFRLTVKDTVEDRILALQQKKREMVANAFGEDETGGQATRLTLQDLEYLFRAKG
ncbi:unnamed protein product [Coffea canephora]|uniref:Helicase-like transcription factor CHR28 n=1 Tax=Coffea canephora TaxID=49390 RepID=A0A068TU99_COFCA|nr:unnamed protein product [Coffea canephora]